MTCNELNNMIFDASSKVRRLKTFSMILNEVVLGKTISGVQEELPPLDDISELTLALADQADEAMRLLTDKLPLSGGIAP